MRDAPGLAPLRGAEDSVSGDGTLMVRMISSQLVVLSSIGFFRFLSTNSSLTQLPALNASKSEPGGIALIVVVDDAHHRSLQEPLAL